MSTEPFDGRIFLSGLFDGTGAPTARELLHRLNWPPLLRSLLLEDRDLEQECVRWINTFGLGGLDGLVWYLDWRIGQMV